MSIATVRRALLRSLVTRALRDDRPDPARAPAAQAAPRSAAVALTTLLDDAGMLEGSTRIDHSAASLGVVDEMLDVYRDHDVELPRVVRDIAVDYFVETLGRLGLGNELARRFPADQAGLRELLTARATTLVDLHATCAKAVAPA